MKIYTGMGDKGQTGLLNGKRVMKDDLRIELVGIMDELTSMLGLAKSSLIEDKKLYYEVEEIQKLLVLIMADISEGKEKSIRIPDNIVRKLEGLIDEYQSKFPPRNKFVIPGENKASAFIDVARTIARKAERAMIKSDREHPIDENEKTYMNRLSDYLYTAARFVDFKEMLTEKITSALEEKYKGGINLAGEAKMNLDTAKFIIDALEKKAKEMKLSLAISAADEKGNLIAFHFMDGTLPVSVDVSIKKAYTAAALKMSTEELAKISQPGQPLYGIANANEKIIVFGGGCPLKVNGSVIGALAVSGGTAEQDTEIARFGVKVFEEKFIKDKYQS